MLKNEVVLMWSKTQIFENGKPLQLPSLNMSRVKMNVFGTLDMFNDSSLLSAIK